MIITYNDLRDIRQKHKDSTIAYGGGTFDLFHVGHLDLFKKLKSWGDIVVVGITSDDRARARKGPYRPIIPEDQRLEIIDAVRYIDYTFLLPAHTPNIAIRGHKILKDLCPDIFAFSDEHSAWFKDEKWLNEQGTTLRMFPRFNENVSTTKIIEHIKKIN